MTPLCRNEFQHMMHVETLKKCLEENKEDTMSNTD